MYRYEILDRYRGKGGYKFVESDQLVPLCKSYPCKNHSATLGICCCERGGGGGGEGEKEINQAKIGGTLVELWSRRF